MDSDLNLANRSADEALPAGDGAAPCAPGHESEAPNPGRVIALNADFARRGVWAGVEDLVEQAYLDLSAKGLRDILDTHNYELHLALPRHRDGVPLAYASLTDTATGVEKTRNFPLDRAYRIVHGLVGLILQWRDSCPEPGSWTILVGKFDDSQHLARRFFVELARRAARRYRRPCGNSLGSRGGGARPAPVVAGRPGGGSRAGAGGGEALTEPGRDRQARASRRNARPRYDGGALSGAAGALPSNGRRASGRSGRSQGLLPLQSLRLLS
jgi:hypothetical protein